MLRGGLSFESKGKCEAVTVVGAGPVPQQECLDISDLQDTVDALLPHYIGLRETRWITRFRSPI